MTFRIRGLAGYSYQVPADNQPSLWERKRLEAMRRIQAVALDLFDADGYRNVTVERVATQAAVSPSSIYRYFGTKEMLVLWDEYDPQILAMLAQTGETTTPAELLDMLGVAAVYLVDAVLTADMTGQIQQRMRFMATEPEVRAGLTRQGMDMEVQIREILGNRLGGAVSELDLRLVAASSVWGFHAALMHWAEGGFAEPLRDVLVSALKFIIGAARSRLVEDDQPDGSVVT